MPTFIAERMDVIICAFVSIGKVARMKFLPQDEEKTEAKSSQIIRYNGSRRIAIVTIHENRTLTTIYNGIITFHQIVSQRFYLSA